MHLVCEFSEVCPGYVQFQVHKGSSLEVKSQIWRELKLVRDFIPVLINCRFDENPINNEGAFVCAHNILHYMYMGIIFNTQGQVTPKLMVGSGKNFKLPEILYLFWLPARFMKIQ